MVHPALPNIPAMSSDIKKHIDFDRLKRANDLCWKWGQRFNISLHDYTTFIVRLSKKIPEYKQKLEVRYRCQFVKDCKVMFYAAEIEEVMVKQYGAMVIAIMKRLKVPQNEYDELATDGLMAVRTALWNYRNIPGAKASFTTYCYNSIMMRIRGTRSKDYKKKQRREDICNIANATDLSEKFDFNLFSKKTTVAHEFVDEKKEIDEVLKMCDLNEKEEFLIRSFICRYQGDPNTRQKGIRWYSSFVDKYRNPRKNTKYSRQGVYNQLVRIQMKILTIMKNSERVDPNYQLPLSLKGVI